MTVGHFHELKIASAHCADCADALTTVIRGGNVQKCVAVVDLRLTRVGYADGSVVLSRERLRVKRLDPLHHLEYRGASFIEGRLLPRRCGRLTSAGSFSCRSSAMASDYLREPADSSFDRTDAKSSPTS